MRENAGFHFYAACFTVLVCGLLLPRVALHGLERGFLVWFIICLATCVILAGVNPLTLWRAIMMAALTSSLLVLALAFGHIASWHISHMLGAATPHMPITFGTSTVDVFEPKFFLFLIVIVLELWVASAVIISGLTLLIRRWLNKTPQYRAALNEAMPALPKTVTLISTACACLTTVAGVFA